MLFKQIRVEFQHALSFDRILVWAVLIFTPTIVQFFMVNEGYAYSNSIEFYQRLISGFIPMLFPIFMILIYSDSYISETKHNYILYAGIRIWLPTYLLSKGIVNAVLSFIISFLLVFLPFLFATLFGSSTTIIDMQDQNPGNKMTFNQFLVYGTFVYGIVYSCWVAINGMVYATITFLLTICIKNPFIALSIPFVWYQSMNFITAILGIEIFSPLSTIFPFNLTQQELWTVFIPFSVLILVIVGMVIFIRYKLNNELINE